MSNPLQEMLRCQGVVILDGGLATSLEERGHKLDSHLWSTRVLLEAPEEIETVHRLFIEAGADCITTASYQASYEGLSRVGYDTASVDELLIRSVTLARDAVDGFWSDVDSPPGRLRPLVAASVGPYGAHLADGSEYVGGYGITHQELVNFHKRRFRILAMSEADLVVCETIPSLAEVKALLSLFDQIPDAWGWISFSCRDGSHLNDGTPIEVAVDLCEHVEGLVGVGVNCTAPKFVNELIHRIQMRTDRSIIVYPNIGGSWNAEKREWIGEDLGEYWVKMAETWSETGAQVVGGCCRIGPELIEQVRRQIVQI